MWFIRGGKPAAVRTRKRESDRFGSDLLTCPLGDVYDLSGTGIRLRGKGRCKLAMGQVLAVTLQAPQGQLTLQAKVVRIQRQGLRTYDVGMQFIGIKPGTARALRTLAEFGFVSGRGPASPAGASAPAADPVFAKNAVQAAKLERARQVLNVTSDVSAEQLKLAYRKLARAYHPDVRRDADSNQKFADISDAYQTLLKAMKS